MKYFHTLKVLLWKHALVRKRRIISTIMEAAMPIMLYLFLYGAKSGMRKAASMPPKLSEQMDSYDLNMPVQRLVFFPNTSTTNMLMALVGSALSLPESDCIPEVSKTGYFAMTNKFDLDSFRKTMSERDAIVIFQNLNTDIWPKTLNYTIRIKGFINNKEIDSNFVPPMGYRRMYEYFTTLQWAIDKSFLEISSGVPINKEVTLQEMPPSASINAMMALIVVEFNKTFLFLALILPFVLLCNRIIIERISGMKLFVSSGARMTVASVGCNQSRILSGVGSYLRAPPCLGKHAKPLVSVSISNNNGRQDYKLLSTNSPVQRPYLSSGAHQVVDDDEEMIVMSGVSASTISCAHLINAIPHMILFCIVATLVLKIPPSPLVPFSSAGLIFLAFLLHYDSILALALPCSYVVTSTSYMTTWVLLQYLLLTIPTIILQSVTKNTVLKIMMGLLPMMPAYWFWNEVMSLEKNGRGLTPSEIFKKHSPQTMPVAWCYLMMLVQYEVWRLLAVYLDKVWPGKYGVGLPWNYLCSNRHKQRDAPDKLFDDETEPMDPKYFEAPPADTEVGVKVVNVTKVFTTWRRMQPNTIALRKLNLDILKGEITVLLGHNGAGKTTLMSIISGMMSPTYGNVYVNGIDSEKRELVSRNMGYCPQHNVSYPDITILEHIRFFAMLKGTSFKESKPSAMELVHMLKLNGKENSLSSELSGGMKRRLQLACALAGDCNVLILDEPTSGLDVETRRELWNLLLNLRGNKTVLLSTHFMEEADALGDRVAAIHSGSLRCHATPMFLKRSIGTGYKLTFTLNKNANKDNVKKTVQRYVEDAKELDQTTSALVYILPAASSHKFHKLFNALEKQKESLGIVTIGVGATDLDDVFLKLCSDVVSTDVDDTDTDQVDKAVAYEKAKGSSLLMQIVKALIIRRLKWIRAKKLHFIFLTFLVPVFLFCCLTHFSTFVEKDANTQATTVALDMFQPMGRKKVLLNIDNESSALRTFQSYYKDIDFLPSYDVESDIKSLRDNDETRYKDYVLGLQIMDNNVSVRYSKSMAHAPAAGVNLLSNVLAASLLPETEHGYTITTVSDPIELSQSKQITPAKTESNSLSWAVIVTYVLMITLNTGATLPSLERETGSRHFQIMSGCPPAVYWMVTLASDVLIYAVINITTLVIACLVLDKDQTFTRLDFLLAFCLIALLGGIAYLCFVYFLTFLFSATSVNIAANVWLFMFGLVMAIVKSVLNDSKMFIYKIFKCVALASPPYPFITGVMAIMGTAQKNAYCHLNKHFCPNIPVTINKFNKDRCCATKSSWGPFNYFGYEEGGFELLILSLNIIVYSMLVLVMEYGIGKYVYDKVFNMFYKPAPKIYDDPLAKTEEAYVKASIRSPQKNDAGMAFDLHKKYFHCCRKSKVAVNGTSFTVKKGECFGLLGVNGAGKSSTFKMLTAEEPMTRGELYANRHYLKIMQRREYLYSLGYCPQFGGVDSFLTGAENLQLLLSIRGLKREDIKKEVTTWIQCLGLERYADRAVSEYSGGCQRRLSAAAALSTSAPISLLDEPTSGVDTAARRRVWAALRRGLRQNRAVIITSHSMDEMEALCHRIAIMSGGEIGTLGSPAALRAEHASGYALRLKLHPAEMWGDRTVGELKYEIHTTYQAYLRDEHKTMLHYQIVDRVPYSQLFEFLERLKATHGSVLEDYAASDTTLEEVFLSFAKQHNVKPVA